MNVLKSALKRLALKYLPERTLQQIRKIHYARTVRRITPDAEPDLRVLEHLVKPGDWVADIGANIGVYTKFLSQLVGPSGRVFSFEPVPATFEILTSNIRRMSLQNVEAHNCAISGYNGTVTLEVPCYPEGGENLYEARIVNETSSSSLRRVCIESRSIDSVVTGHEKDLSFIKCDVEGHELSCVRGAAAIIKRSQPAWLIEISDNPEQPGSKADTLFNLLAEDEYVPYLFDGTSLRRRRSREVSVNYFFLRPSHLGTLGQVLNDR